MIRRAAALAALLLAIAPSVAHGDAYAPPAGALYHGLTGGESVASFERETGKHPPVFQFFTAWGQRTEWMFRAADSARARLMLHISTASRTRELLTPQDIAQGHGDGYLLRLARRIDDSGRIVYIRLMSEMNGHWNAYSAFDRSGRRRGRAHSTATFRQAWRRTVLVVRGGPVAAVNARLARLGLPPVQTSADTLPQPRVAFQWVPQTAGSPDVPGNGPRAYWPGAAYVDWVGTDFYSKFPNFHWLERFYRSFAGKPFVFGEWALWGRDDPACVRRLFGWVRSHRRVRMVMYNQGNVLSGPFRLFHYPRGRRALASELRHPRFAEFAPEFR